MAFNWDCSFVCKLFCLYFCRVWIITGQKGTVQESVSSVVKLSRVPTVWLDYIVPGVKSQWVKTQWHCYCLFLFCCCWSPNVHIHIVRLCKKKNKTHTCISLTFCWPKWNLWLRHSDTELEARWVYQEFWFDIFILILGS